MTRTGTGAARSEDGSFREEKSRIRAVYRRRARRYDLTSRLYWLIGYRVDRYRREGVDALRLAPGDTVVEIGCGTGHNFPLLREAVGPDGRIVGVDLTDAMLAEARARVERHGWANVELVRADAAEYAFPRGVGGVFSTFALTLVPEFDRVVEHAAGALRPGKRMVVVDFKAPETWPRWVLRAIVPLLRPFAVRLELAERHPWESLKRHFGAVEIAERYLGTTYVAAAEAS